MLEIHKMPQLLPQFATWRVVAKVVIFTGQLIIKCTHCAWLHTSSCFLNKTAFVSAENGFEKTIYTLPCVWLCMENLVKLKTISLTVKFGPHNWKMNYTRVLPLNHFQTQTPEERERKSKKKEQSEWAKSTHNPRSHQSRRTPALARSHCLKHRRDCSHDPPMPDLSLSRSTSPFPLIVDHSPFLLLSVWPKFWV